jgi:hypothetical protein
LLKFGDLGRLVKVKFKNFFKEIYGGDKEARTPDPLLAKQMLYQLSYIPVEVF